MEQTVFDLPIINKHYKDLNPIVCGWEQCQSEHSYGPAIREYYLIHYVVKGKGIFIKEDNKYEISAGNAFLIRPDEVTIYTADKDTPWEYIWIGFDGESASAFDDVSDVFKISESLFRGYYDAVDYGNCINEYLLSQLYMLYADIFRETNEKVNYIHQVCDYIKAHYADDIKISNIAKLVGLERTYLAKLFKEKKGRSMQEYLIDVRINKGAELLKKGYGVNETSAMVGYGDVCNFSKMFKRKMRVSPITYKNNSNNL